jgi:DtxR family transcriptional regulator, Mn-dependent transcriptional regulator
MSQSESREMYLKSIYELKNAEEPVAISSIALRMGVSTVSASEMIKHLAEQGFVDHQPYKGVSLTEAGCKRAVNVVRRQRLWARFLADHLGIPWERIYDFACRLEHATDDTVTEAMAEFLDHPRYCPHGNPIPTSDGSVEEIPTISLTEIEPGQQVEIRQIDQPETALCVYLADRGLLPGTQLTYIEQAPYNGPLTVKVDDKEIAVGREIALRVLVSVPDAAD